MISHPGLLNGVAGANGRSLAGKKYTASVSH